MFLSCVFCETSFNLGEKVQVYCLISSPKTYQLTLQLKTPSHWTCSFVCHFNYTESIQSCRHLGAFSLFIEHIAISLLPVTHLHLSKEKHVKVKCCAHGNKHRNNALTLRGGRPDISRKTCSKWV